MDSITFVCCIALIAGLYSTWNIGANDVSNAMGTSVGSKSLSLKQAVIIAAICEFTGAWLFGSHVSDTIREGLLNTSYIESLHGKYSIVRGMLAALFATGMWLHSASYLGLPVSTTHAIVGAIVGFGLSAGGTAAIQWEQVYSIASSWIISPILGGIGSFFIFTIIRKNILAKPSPLQSGIKALPWIFATFIAIVGTIWVESYPFEPSTIALFLLVIFTLSYKLFQVIQKQYCKNISPEETDYIEKMEALYQMKEELLTLPEGEKKNSLNTQVLDLTLKVQPSLIAHYEEQQFSRLEKLFSLLQVATAALMAFSHGANDVANGIGPLEAILDIFSQENSWLAQACMPYILFLGGIGIVTGLATWGWKVIETIGKNITELTPSRGFSAEFGASITILIASKYGFPISTTHTLVGSVIGVGLAGGITSLNITTLRDIIASWIITIPGGALLSILLYHLLSFLLPL